MATYAEIFALSQDGNVTAQICVAMTNDAKYAVQTSTDPDTIKWANYVIPNTRAEAQKWQLMICSDTAIADAVVVRDEDVALAVTALVPTMVASYAQQNPGGA